MPGLLHPPYSASALSLTALTMVVAWVFAGPALAQDAAPQEPLPRLGGETAVPDILRPPGVPDILRRGTAEAVPDQDAQAAAGPAPDEAGPDSPEQEDPAEEGIIASVMRFLFGDGSKPAAVPQPPSVPRGGSSVDLWDVMATVGFTTDRMVVDEKAGTLEVTLRRSVRLDREVKVLVRSQDETAAAGSDYVAVAESVTFPPGVETATLRVAVIDDALWEEPESFQLRLEPLDGGAAEIDAARAVLRVEIRSDDPEPDRSPPPEAKLVLLPSPLTITETPVGERSTGRVRIGNQGNAAARIQRIEVEGADFSLVDDRCSGTQILPNGGFCDVDLAFAPGRAGRASGRVKVTTEVSEIATAVEAFAFEVAVAVVDPMREAAERLRAERDFAGSGAIIGRYAPATPAVQPPEHVMSEPDYRATGIVPAYFTYPVDRRLAITTDRFISCVLETAINSQLPGFVICVVENHVYGSDGRFVLIPAGTRIEGDYQPLAAVGDTRLNVVWRRFFRPDGSSFYVESGFQAQDAMGQAGVPGEVDNRWFERFGAPLLLTAVASGVQFAADAGSGTSTTTNTTQGSAGTTTTQSAASSAAETLAEGLGAVALKLLDETVDLRPRMFVAAGSRITIKPLVDMWFKTPQILAPGEAAPPPAPGTQMVAFPRAGGPINPPTPGPRFQTPRPGQ